MDTRAWKVPEGEHPMTADADHYKIIALICIAGMLMVSCLFVYRYEHQQSAEPTNVTVDKGNPFCIENKCPPSYSGYENNHCMETRCTIQENATISNTSMSVYAYNFTLTSLPKPWANQSCLQNETGQNPDDLVMHFTCEGTP